MSRFILMALAVASGIVVAQPASATEASPAKPCAPSVYSDILSPATDDDSSYLLTCSLSLKPDDVVRRKLLLQGEVASGITIDCNGARIGVPEIKSTLKAPTVGIWSQQGGTTGQPVWSRPTDIVIRDCTIVGAVRIWGIGAGHEIPIQVQESRNPDFTDRAQRAAPTRIQLLDSQFDAAGAIPLYVGPGTTHLTLRGSTISGKAALAIYLDAESADNRIEGNTIDLEARRELIAVDGAARNVIANNTFGELSKGGAIRLYRNCGERAVIRHQTPSENQIYDNRFVKGTDLSRAIIENSRTNRKRASFCGLDAGYPFGSSINDDDLGHDNIIRSNTIAE